MASQDLAELGFKQDPSQAGQTTGASTAEKAKTDNQTGYVAGLKRFKQ